MPYLPVAHPPQAEVLASAERRWQALVEAKPDLQAAVDLQRGLLTLVIELARAIDGGRMPRLSLPAKYLAAKLSRGVPVLAGEPIPLPAVDMCLVTVGESRLLTSPGTPFRFPAAEERG